MMNQVISRLKQAEANRILKAAAKAGGSWRIEFRPDGTIVATMNNSLCGGSSVEVPAETPEQLRKLI
jgi:hypothetical protein